MILLLWAQETPEFKENDLSVRVDEDGKFTVRNRAATWDHLEVLFLSHLDRFGDANGKATYSLFLHADPETRFEIIQDVLYRAYGIGTCYLTIDDKKFVELRESPISDDIVALKLEICFIPDLAWKGLYRHRDHHSKAKNGGDLHATFDMMADCGKLLSKDSAGLEEKGLQSIVDSVRDRLEIESAVKGRSPWIQIDADDEVPIRIPYAAMERLQEKRFAPIEIYTTPSMYREESRKKK